MRQPASLLFSLAFVLCASGCAPGSATGGQPTPGTSGTQPPGLDLANRPAVEGITRTTLRDDARATVTRVHFAPGAAEPIHTHPTEIMIVPVMAGAVTWIVDGQSTAYLEAGAVQFVAAGVPHQLANTSGVPFEIIAVALK